MTILKLKFAKLTPTATTTKKINPIFKTSIYWTNFDFDLRIAYLKIVYNFNSLFFICLKKLL